MHYTYLFTKFNFFFKKNHVFENSMFFKCQQKLLCIYSIDGGVHLKNSRFPADDVQSSGSRRAAHGISYTNTSYVRPS